jgi:ABC-type transport system involved in multi-copper enzyme maturation permease subunit
MRANGAVLWIELQTRLKERKVWVISVLFLICLSVMSFLTLLTLNLRYGVNAPAMTGMSLWSASTIFLLTLLLILSPLASAGRITEEREARTLSSLLNTPLPLWEIVLGKLAGSWIFIVWLGTLAVPFLTIAFLWGGCDVRGAALAFAWILAAAFTTCAVGIGFSGFFSRTLNSYLGTGAFLFFWMAAWPLIGSIFLQTLDRHQERLRPLTFIFFEHNPFALVYFTFAPNEIGPWAAMVVWPVIAVFFLCLARRGMGRGLVDRG